MNIELEQKYLVDSDRPWMVQAQLLALLERAGYALSPTGEGPQSDTYYDTPEDTLLQGGGSLRLRRKGETRILTVKTPIQGENGAGGTFLRREEELELSPGADPAAFLATLLPGVDLKSLCPAAEVENLRRTYAVSGPAGSRFELAFDDVTFRSPRTGREAGERQVEIERLSGTEEDLARLVGESAAKLPALRAAAGSKYQRARKNTG